MKDGEPCGKKEKCLKETNPFAEDPENRGKFLGKPYIFEECWMACHFCCSLDNKLVFEGLKNDGGDEPDKW